MSHDEEGWEVALNELGGQVFFSLFVLCFQGVLLLFFVLPSLTFLPIYMSHPITFLTSVEIRHSFTHF